MLLLVVFMLVANILLVNLLIAMMSSTYERVEGEAKRVWALQSAELLDEFTQRYPCRLLIRLLTSHRWFFPTPFHIFRNIYLAGRWVHDRFFRDCCSNRINQDPAAEQGSIPLPYKPYGKLRKFLAEETDKYANLVLRQPDHPKVLPTPQAYAARHSRRASLQARSKCPRGH